MRYEIEKEYHLVEITSTKEHIFKTYCFIHTDQAWVLRELEKIKIRFPAGKYEVIEKYAVVQWTQESHGPRRQLLRVYSDEDMALTWLKELEIKNTNPHTIDQEF